MPAEPSRPAPEQRTRRRDRPARDERPLPHGDIGSLVGGLSESAAKVGPPLILAAVILLLLSLSSGGFLVVATRRLGARRL